MDVKQEIDGTCYDTDEMLDLGIAPVEHWQGGDCMLMGVFADQRGQLFVLENSPFVGRALNGVAAAGDCLILAGPDLVAYLVKRFDLPAIYLREVQR